MNIERSFHTRDIFPRVRTHVLLQFHRVLSLSSLFIDRDIQIYNKFLFHKQKYEYIFLPNVNITVQNVRIYFYKIDNKELLVDPRVSFLNFSSKYRFHSSLRVRPEYALKNSLNVRKILG